MSEGPTVRPFLLTGGRTRPPREDLRVESLLRARLDVPLGGLRFESRLIWELCREPTSIAEIASALRVPLGVARILAGDLAAGGYLVVVQDRAVSVDVLERMRDRVSAL